MVKLFLAGAESIPRAWLKEYPFLLTSFMYRKGLERGFWEETSKSNAQVLLDSGAFTYIENPKVKSGEMKMPDPFEYAHDYCEYVREHHDKIWTFVELDIDPVVGWEKQLALREVFDSYNLDPLYVYHKTNPVSFEEYCTKRDYVGFPARECSTQRIRKYLSIADKHGTSVHIFAYTQPTELNAMRYFKSFYSADSTSWLMSQKFARPDIFKNGKLEYISDKDWRRRWASMEFGEFGDIPAKDRLRWGFVQHRRAGLALVNLHDTTKGQVRFEVEESRPKEPIPEKQLKLEEVVE